MRRIISQSVSCQPSGRARQSWSFGFSLAPWYHLFMPEAFPVILAPYNPDWPKMAASYAQGLRVLGSVLVVVHHIGSTAVLGLATKPIIDLMPLVTSLDDLDQDRWRVEALGYGWHGELGISGRRYCTLCDRTGLRIVQLHFFKADSPDVERHIAFRDYLRAHPDAARAYENEKRRARDLHPNDSHAYCDEKAAWIRSTEALALAWFAEHYPRFVSTRFLTERQKLPERVRGLRRRLINHTDFGDHKCRCQHGTPHDRNGRNSLPNRGLTR